MTWRASLGLLLVLSGAGTARGESLEPYVRRMLQAQAFCESGTWGATYGSGTPMAHFEYRLCAHRDGRFRYDVSPGKPEQITLWSDGKTLHRYAIAHRAYQAHAVASSDAKNIYERPRVDAPALHSRMLRRLVSADRIEDFPRELGNYQLREDLSDGARKVFDQSGNPGISLSRVIVAGERIVRQESYYDGRMNGYLDVTSQGIDPPLGEADISYPLPWWVSWSPQNDMPRFIGAVYALAVLLAFGLWTRGFARAVDPFHLVRVRSGLWRLFRWSFGFVAGGLGLLAALTWGGSGHPPAIAYVWVMALASASCFGLFAGVLLASYPAQPLANRLRQPAEPS